MRVIFFFTVLMLVLACSNPNSKASEKETTVSAPTLKQLWASDTILRTPESVLYDQDRNLIYVANVNLNPWEKDGNGFISRMDLRGKIIELEWVKGLNGPKGMGIIGTSLFVADIDEVVEIQIESGQVLNRFKVEGTPSLNDISTLNGVVYVSGSEANEVFEIKGGKISSWTAGDFGRPNGLFAEKDRLLMLTSGSSQLKAFDWTTKQSTDLVDSLGHGDGIVPAGNGDYLASSWRGELFYISPNYERHSLLDTREKEINAADIDYVIDKNLLLVPTFYDNRVVAYKLNSVQ